MIIEGSYGKIKILIYLFVLFPFFNYFIKKQYSGNI
jgi:hypothetical protein